MSTAGLRQLGRTRSTPTCLMQAAYFVMFINMLLNYVDCGTAVARFGEIFQWTGILKFSIFFW